MSRHTHPSNRLVLLLALAVVAILALSGMSPERIPIPSVEPTPPPQESSATERHAVFLARAQSRGTFNASIDPALAP